MTFVMRKTRFSAQILKIFPVVRSISYLSLLLAVLWHTAAWSSIDSSPAINVDNPHKVPGTNLDQKSFALTIIKRPVPSRTLDELLQEMGGMNKYIGAYPPHLTSE